MKEHTVQMMLNSDDLAELIEFYQERISHHKKYVNRAKNNIWENTVKRDIVIEKHEKKIFRYEQLRNEIAEQSW